LLVAVVVMTGVAAMFAFLLLAAGTAMTVMMVMAMVEV
jgi:hypothetical protein